MAIWRFEESGVDYGQLLAGEYSIPTVVASVLIACIAGYATLSVVDLVHKIGIRSFKYVWFATGALTMGLGTWAMHFTGMMAYKVDMPVGYFIPVTILSVLPGIVGGALVVGLLSAKTVNWQRNQITALTLALCIAAMHYTGMEAMRMPSLLKYNLNYFLLSMLVAHVLASLALGIKFVGVTNAAKPSRQRQFFSAIVIGFSISGMHYTAMAATRIYAADSLHLQNTVMSDQALLLSVILVTALLLTIVIAFSSVRANQQIALDAGKTALLLNSTGIGIYSIALNGDCTFANQACLEILGYHSDQELLGKNMHNLIHHTYADGSPYAVEDCKIYLAFRQGEGTHVDDEVLWRKDGSSFPSEYRSFPVFERDQIQGAVVSFADITELRQKERVLNQAQKMEAVGQLTGGIAHDFNNLLGIISGNLRFLRQDIGETSTAIDELFNDARSAAADGVALTQRLLTFSRHQDLQSEIGNVNDTIEDFARFLKRTLAAEIQLGVELPEENLFINVDFSQLENSLLNLALNARDAMPEGGRIIISTARHLIGDGDISPALTEYSYVTVNVSDTGTGIGADDLQHVFEPFFTTKNVGQGSGLGLSMVYGFVQQSKGDCTIVSTPGEGTTVSMYFPEVTDHKIANPDAKDDKEERSLAKSSAVILVVEDEPRVRRATLRDIQELGYQTLEAENATQAMALIESEEHIDLLFSDVLMPGEMNGRMLGLWTKENYPEIEVVLTSGFSKDKIDIDSIGKHSFPMVRKPYSIEKLTAQLRASLEEQEG